MQFQCGMSVYQFSVPAHEMFADKKLKLVLAFPQAVDDRSPTMLDALFEAV